MPRRPDYSALRKTTQELDGVVEPTVPEATPEAKAPTQSVINVDEIRRSYAEGLQVQVNKGRISAVARSELLTQFDKDYSPAPSQDQALQEARELAAAARSHEAAEQAKVIERGEPER